jgi:hypothetical protein
MSLCDLFDSAGVKRLQGASAETTLFLLVQGHERGWWSTYDRNLLVRFRGNSSGHCNISFIRTLNERGGIDPTLSIYVTQAGYDALTSDWYGKTAFQWPLAVCDVGEALSQQSSGAKLIE